MKQASKAKKRPDSKELAEFKRAVKALNAGQHNPINWIPIIKFIAPFIARVAARYASRYVATKLGKRLKVNLSTEVAEATADRIIDLLTSLK